MNRQTARNNLFVAVRLVIDGLEMIGIPPLKGRDHREPGWREKQAFEDMIRSAIVRHFGRQRKKVREYLENEYPNRKQYNYWDDEEDEETIAELIRILQKATRNGIDLFGQRSKLQIDWTLTNKEAAEWAREYVYDLIKDIDKTSREALQSAISQFVETPGMTLRDTMDLLPYDEERAQRIAVTETTRAYSKATQLASEKLKEEFPDVRVVTRWYTNNDELVCELCGPLEGMEVPEGETFYEPSPPYEDGFPPRHVNCRCWVDSFSRIEEGEITQPIEELQIEADLPQNAQEISQEELFNNIEKITNIKPDVKDYIILDDDAFNEFARNHGNAIGVENIAGYNIDNVIYIRAGYEDSALHEFIHSAGFMPIDINISVNEGMTQAFTQDLANKLGIIPRSGYTSEVDWVNKYILPLTGKTREEVFMEYAQAEHKQNYLANTIWNRWGDKFNNVEDWGTGIRDRFIRQAANYVGSDPYLEYLVDELGVLKYYKIDNKQKVKERYWKGQKIRVIYITK